MPNKAPAPNRRHRFPLGTLREFAYLFCAPPASPAAVGEAQRCGSGSNGAVLGDGGRGLATVS
jgi:hypothetical protein